MASLLFLGAFFEAVGRVSRLTAHSEALEGGCCCVVPSCDIETPILTANVGALHEELFSRTRYCAVKVAMELRKAPIEVLTTRYLDGSPTPTFYGGGMAIRGRNYIAAFASEIDDDMVNESVVLCAAALAGDLTWKMARAIAMTGEEPNHVFRGLNPRMEIEPALMSLLVKRMG